MYIAYIYVCTHTYTTTYADTYTYIDDVCDIYIYLSTYIYICTYLCLCILTQNPGCRQGFFFAWLDRRSRGADSKQLPGSPASGVVLNLLAWRPTGLSVKHTVHSI